MEVGEAVARTAAETKVMRDLVVNILKVNVRNVEVWRVCDLQEVVVIEVQDESVWFMLD